MELVEGTCVVCLAEGEAVDFAVEVAGTRLLVCTACVERSAKLTGLTSAKVIAENSKLKSALEEAERVAEEDSKRIDELVGVVAERDRNLAATRDRANQRDGEVNRLRQGVGSVSRIVNGLLMEEVSIPSA